MFRNRGRLQLVNYRNKVFTLLHYHRVSGYIGANIKRMSRRPNQLMVGKEVPNAVEYQGICNDLRTDMGLRRVCIDLVGDCL